MKHSSALSILTVVFGICQCMTIQRSEEIANGNGEIPQEQSLLATITSDNGFEQDHGEQSEPKQSHIISDDHHIPLDNLADAQDGTLEQTVKEKRCKLDGIVGLPSLTRRDTTTTNLLKRSCNNCLSSAMCAIKGKCDSCKKICDKYESYSEQMDEPPSDDQVADQNPGQQEDIVGVSNRLGEQRGAEQGGLSYGDNRYYTVGSFAPGPMLSLLAKLLNIKDAKPIQQLIVLARTKSEHKIKSVRPVVFDTAHVFTVNRGGPSNVDVELHQVGKGGGDLDSITTKLDQEIQQAMREKERMYGTTHLSPKEIDKIILAALGENSSELPGIIARNMSEEEEIEEQEDDEAWKPVKKQKKTMPTPMDNSEKFQRLMIQTANPEESNIVQQIRPKSGIRTTTSAPTTYYSKPGHAIPKSKVKSAERSNERVTITANTEQATEHSSNRNAGDSVGQQPPFRPDSKIFWIKTTTPRVTTTKHWKRPHAPAQGATAPTITLTTTTKRPSQFKIQIGHPIRPKSDIATTPPIPTTIQHSRWPHGPRKNQTQTSHIPTTIKPTFHQDDSSEEEKDSAIHLDSEELNLRQTNSKPVQRPPHAPSRDQINEEMEGISKLRQIASSASLHDQDLVRQPEENIDAFRGASPKEVISKNPGSLYEEKYKKLRQWVEQNSKVPSMESEEKPENRLATDVKDMIDGIITKMDKEISEIAENKLRNSNLMESAKESDGDSRKSEDHSNIEHIVKIPNVQELKARVSPETERKISEIFARERPIGKQRASKARYEIHPRARSEYIDGKWQSEKTEPIRPPYNTKHRETSVAEDADLPTARQQEEDIISDIARNEQEPAEGQINHSEHEDRATNADLARKESSSDKNEGDETVACSKEEDDDDDFEVLHLHPMMHGYRKAEGHEDTKTTSHHKHIHSLMSAPNARSSQSNENTMDDKTQQMISDLNKMHKHGKTEETHDIPMNDPPIHDGNQDYFAQDPSQRYSAPGYIEPIMREAEEIPQDPPSEDFFEDPSSFNQQNMMSQGQFVSSPLLPNRMGEAFSHDMTHMGKFIPMNKERTLSIHSRDVSEQEKQKNMYFIGDGIKLPLNMKEHHDGSLHLSVDLKSLCDCKHCTSKRLENGTLVIEALPLTPEEQRQHEIEIQNRDAKSNESAEHDASSEEAESLDDHKGELPSVHNIESKMEIAKRSPRTKNSLQNNEVDSDLSQISEEESDNQTVIPIKNITRQEILHRLANIGEEKIIKDNKENFELKEEINPQGVVEGPKIKLFTNMIDFVKKLMLDVHSEK